MKMYFYLSHILARLKARGNDDEIYTSQTTLQPGFIYKHLHLHRRRIQRICRIPLLSIVCARVAGSIFQMWVLSPLSLMDPQHQSCSSNFAANSTHTFEMLYKASLAFFVKIISHQQKKAVRQEKTMMARPPNRARTAGSDNGCGPGLILNTWYLSKNGRV